MPWRLLYTSPRFRREVAEFAPANGVRVHVAGIDLVRDEEGRFRVVEDNVRVPSGVSYVIENRSAMTRTFPALFAEQSVHRVDGYPSRLLAAPDGTADPCVVVLAPGVHNAAYFEHTLLAPLMGVELVEGRDLFCSRNRVFVHTTRGDRLPRPLAGQLHGRRHRGADQRPGSLGPGPGLCQDMAHVTVALLRAVGLPARYVSGYLHTDPSAEPGHTTVGESHAWIEHWTGSWHACDLTGGAPVRERHIVVARGRNYADIPRSRASITIPPASAQQVTVETVPRLASAAGRPFPRSLSSLAPQVTRSPTRST